MSLCMSLCKGVPGQPFPKSNRQAETNRKIHAWFQEERRRLERSGVVLFGVVMMLFSMR